VTNMQAHSGTRLGACFSSYQNPPNDKWLISPRMYLGTDPRIELWVQAYNTSYGPELYNIGVSTGGTDPGEFIIVSGSTPEEAPEMWTKRTYNLDAFSQNAVYVGIQCVSNNAFIFMVDDISITSTVGVPETGNGAVSVYPNPAAGRFFISPEPTYTGPMKILMTDLPGHQILEEQALVREGVPVPVDISGLKPGVYFLKLTYDEKTLLRKVIVTN
jgi:hypothetical protein